MTTTSVRGLMRADLAALIVAAATDASTRVFAGPPPDAYGTAKLPAVYMLTPQSEVEVMSAAPIGASIIQRTQEFEIIGIARGVDAQSCYDALDEIALQIEAAVSSGPSNAETWQLQSETIDTEGDTGDNVHGTITLLYLCVYTTLEGYHDAVIVK